MEKINPMAKFQKKPKKLISFLKKLKLLDYLLIIAVLLSTVIAYKFFNREEKWTYIKVTSDNIPSYQIYAINPNDFEVDPSGKRIAEVTDLQIYENPQSLVSNKDVLMHVKILARINSRSGEIEYKNKILKAGSVIDFRFNSGQISTKVMEMGISDVQEKIETKVLMIKLYGQWPWLAENIQIGNGETDGRGQKIIEVISKEIKPAEITVTNASGQTYAGIDPNKVDIILTLKAQVTKRNNELIFRKDERINIGDTITFNANNTKIKDAFIVKIDD